MRYRLSWTFDLYLCVHGKPKGSLCFGIYPSLSLSPHREQAAVLLFLHWSSTIDQLQTISSYLDSGKIIVDKSRYVLLFHNSEFVQILFTSPRA